MWTTDEVGLTGPNGRRIHNRFYSHEAATERLCVMIGGFGYTIESPYMYFSKTIPFEHGFDVLAIDFEYSRDRRFLGMSEKQQESAFQADVKAVAAYILQNAAHQQLLFVGKSLGTTAMFTLLQNAEIKRLTIGAVWLTPATERFGIFEFLKHSSLPGLVATGSRDEFAKDIDFGELSGLRHVVHFSVDGGDHLLETSDRGATLRALEEYLGVLNDFIERL